MKMNPSNKDLSVQVAVIANDISYIKDELRAIKDLIKNSYVTKDEFYPVKEELTATKKIVYGIITVIAIPIIGIIISAIMALIIKK